MEVLKIEMPSVLARELRQAVERGDYASEGEAVCKAVRDWQARRVLKAYSNEVLRQLIQEGLDSGPPVDGEAVRKRRRAKYQSLVMYSDETGFSTS